MSRTYKDRPWEIQFPERDWRFGVEAVPVTRAYYSYPNDKYVEYDSVWYMPLPGVKTKKKRRDDSEWHWMSTPSWWTKMTMIKPERRASRLLERKALISDLEDFEIPDTGRKPHIYYW